MKGNNFPYKKALLSLACALVIGTSSTAYLNSQSMGYNSIFGGGSSSGESLEETAKPKAVTYRPTSIYGEDKPDTKEELCSFLEHKLADPDALSFREKFRFQLDYDLHCLIDEFADDLLKAAEEEVVDWSQYPAGLKVQNLGGMRGFLREAREGADVIMGSNNLLDLLGITPQQNEVTSNEE